MTDEDDYTDDPLQTAATTAERTETNATEAINALDRGPTAGEIEEAMDDIQQAVNEIDRQQEAAESALSDLQRGTYGTGGVRDLADGADDAYDLLEEIRGMSRAMVEGLVAASEPNESVSETTILIDGCEYRVRICPLGEAETGKPIDEDE